MPSSSIDRPLTAVRFLRALVAILRAGGGPTWRLLVEATAGRAALIDFDGVRLRLEGQATPTYELRITPDRSTDPLNFRMEAQAVRDILAGRLTLDRALAGGQVFVRGSLADLLALYRLTLRILADSATSPALRRLCIDFDETWPAEAGAPAPKPLESQRPRLGYLVDRIPNEVLRVDLS